MVLMLGWAAAAAGSEQERVLIKDDCDPATFNAAIAGRFTDVRELA